MSTYMERFSDGTFANYKIVEEGGVPMWEGHRIDNYGRPRGVSIGANLGIVRSLLWEMVRKEIARRERKRQC